MSASRKPTPTDRAARPTGPGRPKDLGKRAAILEAATRLFMTTGYEGTSMDQVATEAGVSKLTVYSHFGDKEGLFANAVQSHCEHYLPPLMFEPEPAPPLREHLLHIARAFFDMISAPEAVIAHRILYSPQIANSPLAEKFWNAGPRLLQDGFAQMLRNRIQAGELDIPDVSRATSQFFCLAKGECHERLVLGCVVDQSETATRAHLEATVDMFLRAYAAAPGTERPASRRKMTKMSIDNDTPAPELDASAATAGRGTSRSKVRVTSGTKLPKGRG